MLDLSSNWTEDGSRWSDQLQAWAISVENHIIDKVSNKSMSHLS